MVVFWWLIFLDCTTGCLTCGGPGLDISPVECLRCDNSLGYFLNLAGTECVASCGENQIGDVYGLVEQCLCNYTAGYFANSDSIDCVLCPQDEYYDRFSDSCKGCFLFYFIFVICALLKSNNQ